MQETFSPGNLAPSAKGTQAESYIFKLIHVYIYTYIKGGRWVLVCSKCSTAPPSGRRDSSGIRLHLTRSLRRYDAGIMELGLVYTPVMAVPPQQRSFYLSGYCTSKCTRTVCSSAQTQHTNNPPKPVLVSGFAQRLDLRPCPVSPRLCHQGASGSLRRSCTRTWRAAA